MRVLLFHPVQLPAQHYGGTERVVMWLARGLLELGHEVQIAALESSRLPSDMKHLSVARGQCSLTDVLPLIPDSTDVIHFMAPPGAEELSRLSIPHITTVHGNGKPGEVFPRNTVFLSEDHARRHGSRIFVHNGIDPQEYVFNPGKRENPFLFFSKTSWNVKNLAGAMRRCKKAGAPLWIAGGSRPWHKRVESFLTPGFRWLGSVGGEEKAKVFSRAKALLFPVIWDEPFGLVVAEALMSGTPVIASRKGSLPELVHPEVGTLLGDQDEEWIDWLKRDTLPWSPQACRDWAMHRFHYRRMAEDYVKLYQRVVKGEGLEEKK